MPEQEPSPASPPLASEDVGDLRFYLAAERTLLSWVRTALSMIALGFVIARFALFLGELRTIHPGGPEAFAAQHPNASSGEFSLWMGVILILVGVLLCALAAVDHAHFRQRYRAGLPYRIPKVSTGLLLAGILSVLGVIMAVYLAIFAYL